MPFNTPTIRAQFPILKQENAYIYLDSAATAHMPSVAMTAMQLFEETYRANVHRGMHSSAEQSTQQYESSRKTVQNFINAQRSEEIIFTKNTTESINLVARSFGSTLKKGDGIVLSILEHHSNIIPWLQLKEERGIEIHWIDLHEDRSLQMDQYKSYLEKGTIKIVAITGQSNVLGVRPPIKEMITMAHDVGAIALIDAAQLAAHHAIDVQEVDCDFLVFSGHKTYGPTGIGVLYGKRALLEKMPPFLGGGMMIHEVTKNEYTSTDIPAKFEAGTPPIAQAIGLAAALQWFQSFGWKEKEDHEKVLLHTAISALSTISGVDILGPTKLDAASGCISFTTEGIHPHDLTHIIGQQGICMRAGHHCTQPLHKALGLTATTRLSVGIYNTIEEIELAIPAIQSAIQQFA